MTLGAPEPRAAAVVYPALEPYAAGRLPVDDPHAIHFEQCGNRRGFPTLFLHGGPGSHSRPAHRRFFDPEFYRVVLFDQRGAGQSTPLGCTQANTTRHLVEDIEALCRHLELGRVMLFGGSWGSTLALAYAKVHPERVAGMVLRGVFLASRTELDWYLCGLRNFVPRAWDALAQGDGDRLLERYHALVNERDERRARVAAERWVAYEEAVMGLGAAQKGTGMAQDPAAALARARIQLHYLAHDCFLGPGELLTGLQCLAGVPVLIVQGELDMACPPRAAFELAGQLPQAELRVVERSGHSATEPDMAAALCRAADDMRGRLQGARTR